MGRHSCDPERGEYSKESRFREAVLKRLWVYVVKPVGYWKDPAVHRSHQHLIDEVLMLSEHLPNPAECPSGHATEVITVLLEQVANPSLCELTVETLLGIVEESAKEVER